MLGMSEVGTSRGAAIPETGQPAIGEGARTITLAELAAYVVGRDAVIQTDLIALEAVRPNEFSTPKATTAWAGEVGRQAGRRAELIALVQEFMPTGTVEAAVPLNEERLAG